MLLVVEDVSVRKARLRDYIDVVHALLNLIPPGFVSRYSDIGRVLGISPRLVGLILSLNEDLIVTPCHRVVRSDGSIGGYTGFGGVIFKKKLLELEGVLFEDGRISRSCFIDLSKWLGENRSDNVNGFG